MEDLLFLSLRVLTILCACFCMSFSKSDGRECYHAKICIHNAVERCGIDENGKVRRFLDSCDIKEYNCLKGTGYIKTNFEKCASLPPIPNEKNAEDKTKNKKKAPSPIPIKHIGNMELSDDKLTSKTNNRVIENGENKRIVMNAKENVGKKMETNVEENAEDYEEDNVEENLEEVENKNETNNQDKELKLANNEEHKHNVNVTGTAQLNNEKGNTQNEYKENNEDKEAVKD